MRGQYGYAERGKRELEFLNEHLQVDIHTLVTPKLIRWFPETNPNLDGLLLPTPRGMLQQSGALWVRSDMVPETERTTRLPHTSNYGVYEPNQSP